MRNPFTILLGLVCLLSLSPCRAEFIVDNRFNGYPVELWSRSNHPFFVKWKKILTREIAQDNDGMEPPSWQGHAFHILWNGKHYYAWSASFAVAAQYREYQTALEERRDSRRLPGGSICTLYVFDEQLSKVASLTIDLPEENHDTWCYKIWWLDPAGSGISGVLMNLSYSLASRPSAKDRDMTVLVRFEERDGKLVLRQDDSCLGNPNSFSRTLLAQKALARCVATGQPAR